MSRARVESWSAVRSFAFLAAVFAMAFGAMVPAVVAASASSTAPIVLCSGGQLRIVSGDDGGDRHGDAASLTCAMALLGGPAALPTPEPTPVIAQPVAVEAVVAPSEARFVLPPARAPPRPPSTAPPVA